MTMCANRLYVAGFGIITVIITGVLQDAMAAGTIATLVTTTAPDNIYASEQATSTRPATY